MRIILRYWKIIATLSVIAAFACLMPYYSPKEDTEAKVFKYQENNKYILLWTSPNNIPFIYLGKGQEGFVQRNCEYQNCFVISDKKYFRNYTQFDAIAFSGPELSRLFRTSLSGKYLPQERSPHQKYVFASIESAHNYPVCAPYFDDYFNWTWTYRLDSERRWGSLIIKDIHGKVIGPSKNMHWIKPEDMKPVKKNLKNLFKKKHKTAAWFVSNCKTRSKREIFVNFLKRELKKYKLKIDIYGKCGKYDCSRKNELQCNKMLETDYFFYLAFENSFSEDYVTEKILRALQFKTIPIVYGGTNYSRFMPDGAYLNAVELGYERLALEMSLLVMDKELYSNYFKWTNHYKYHGPAEDAITDDYCGFCSILNEEDEVKEMTVYKNFRTWWNPPDYVCKYD